MDLFVDSQIEKKQNRIKCSFCDSAHNSNSCNEIKGLSFVEKLNILRKKGICYRCLKKANHLGKQCLSGIFCSCGGKHAEIMCNSKEKEKKTHLIGNDDSSALMLSNRSESSVYLQTLIAEIKGKNGSVLIRIVVDSGSENSYLSKYVIEKLNLRKIKTENIKHGLFGGIELSEQHNKYKVTLRSVNKNFSFQIEALDMNKICAGINHVSDKNLIKSLENENIYLSDVYEKRNLCLYEHNPEEIHMLIGADYAAHLYTQNVKYLPDLGLSAFNTKLGWVIMGKNDCHGNRQNKSLSVLSLSLHVSNAKLSDLWRLDTLGIIGEDNKTKEELEKETQNHFLETVKRDESGRYEVSLPWTVDHSILADNRSLAEKCLYKTESKLTNSKKRKEYGEIFEVWENNQIIEEVLDKKQNKVHYLAHRPVIKESSETTKIRPVFNASAHTRNSPSLNDCLTKGPNLIEMIPSILNKFRKYKIGVSSDIEKAFLQIKIAEKDRDFLRFFWFNSENKLKIFRHCRVVFGLTSSPFLLMATLNHLLSDVPEHWRETARLLKDSFYIDNSLISLNSIPETEKFITESRNILSPAHFNLRCWRSNVPEAIVHEDVKELEHAPVLGLFWNLKNDSLKCKLEENLKLDQPFTKRKILSVVQKIFDPIGFTAPASLVPKLILQETWSQKLKWDDELPENLKIQVINWIKHIHFLQEIEVPRWLNISLENENLSSLHVFTDASRKAYATCVYVRTETVKGIKIQLVNARSRVAPLKELTIPRLELLSCLIGARLAKTVSTNLKLTGNITFWSDSSTALSWIRREQAWGTFVHNRVLEIRKLSKIENWRHISGVLNPADLPSRGCSFKKLKNSRWWEGPEWLYLPEDQWPQSEEQPDEESINQEKRKTIINLLNKEENNYKNFYRYFSSYTKNVRMIAWMNRFYQNSKNKEKIISSNLSVAEIEKAEVILLRLVQKESFSGKEDPKLRNLRPLEDKNGLLRVKTAIIHRDDKDDFLYPIILPSQHPVVTRLIFEKHAEKLHAGVGILMAQLRERFWILKARKSIRSVIHKCVKCRRYQAPRLEAEFGVPPEDRVRNAAVFEVTGVDLAGPLHLSDGSKIWIALFTCAVYRAVHLEIVSSLSTECFIQSLRRFIARRGRPYVMYSDNGKNFLGTQRALANLDWDSISAAASTQKIRWKFNPPAAPWWGGWWERLVRMMKEILRKVLGRASLNYEEMNTILCDCERILNSRPITYVSEDTRDPEPLSPLMFLQELPQSGVPDIDALDSEQLNRRAKYRQRIRTDLKNRFRKEYLGQLKQYAVKKAYNKQPKIGDIVLLEDVNKKRLLWPLAKIIKVYPAKDNIVRLAKVKTANGDFIRPVQRLFPLEVDIANCPTTDSLTREFLRNVNRKELVKNSPEATSSRISDVKTTLDDPTSSHPIVTRTGRVVKAPQRLQI